MSFHDAVSAAALYLTGILNFLPTSVALGLLKAWVAPGYILNI